MDEAEAAGYTIEDGDDKGMATAIEHAGENPTAGRRLGGTRSGATARYDT